MSYSYSETNRLKAPHSYMYTPFEGSALLDAYRLSRREAIDWCRANRSARAAFDNDLIGSAFGKIELELQTSSPGSAKAFRALHEPETRLPAHRLTPEHLEERAAELGRFSIDRKIETEELIVSLVCACLLDIPRSACKPWIDRIIQRFEVSKKVYRFYLPGFRKGEGDDSNIRLYWLISLMLVLLCVDFADLKCLNTLLKVSDLLCSLPRDEILQYISADGLLLVLATELCVIDSMIHDRGLDGAA